MLFFLHNYRNKNNIPFQDENPFQDISKKENFSDLIIEDRFPSRQTIDSCICNGLMDTEPGGLNGNKLSFLTNLALIGGTMMSVLVLDDMPVNIAFQSALSNVIAAEHPELCFGVRFHIIDDVSCYELR
ncbi:hypothetical protein TNCV_3506421 [Trichonephila clavipes]|uniref:Uncharacterized protein n=1 Tax=Trichonephila clavipes TaxID=2585209 RepID=A0A8X6RVV1_TRICX|nr:hypothetical protein TNCV_3506421 [Trichonephila clavipes]